MQIYLPHKNYRKTAEVLHKDDLVRQRDNCAKMIRMFLYDLDEIECYKKEISEFEKIRDNPVYKFWWNEGNPYLDSLYKYYECINFECLNRGLKLIKLENYRKIIAEIKRKIHLGKPTISKRMTTGYRIILLSRNEAFYKKIFIGTYQRYKNEIASLSKSKERFKFAKTAGLTR